MTMNKCIRCIVSGRVQGVFFRDATRGKALELGVNGWVRNRGDGTVEVVAAGEAMAMAALRQWLEIGPPRARVDRVVCDDVTCDGTWDGFAIRPTE